MAAQRAREQKQLLRDQQDQQRRLERQAREEACMQALVHHEAAATARKAQEALCLTDISRQARNGVASLTVSLILQNHDVA